MDEKGERQFNRKLKRAISKLPDSDFTRVIEWSKSYVTDADDDIGSLIRTELKYIRKKSTDRCPYIGDLLNIIAEEVGSKDIRDKVSFVRRTDGRVIPYVWVLNLVSDILYLNDKLIFEDSPNMEHFIRMALMLKDVDNVTTSNVWLYFNDNYASIHAIVSSIRRDNEEKELAALESEIKRVQENNL